MLTTTLRTAATTPATLNGRRAAWQSLSGMFDRRPNEAKTSAELIESHGLAWRVEKEPIKLAHDGRDVPGHYALVRQDTRATLSIVGEAFEPLQNVAAFGFLDSLLM